jgi:hypothetical protein
MYHFIPDMLLTLRNVNVLARLVANGCPLSKKVVLKDRESAPTEDDVAGPTIVAHRTSHVYGTILPI